MASADNVETISQRSLERVRDLGEVFTPPSSVEEMLNLLSNGRKQFWCDESNVFFEPNCGHGNIVIGIFGKRLEALYKKACLQKYKEPAFYAVANSVNTLWAIDIDAQNISECRNRVFMQLLLFLHQKTGISTQQALIKLHTVFFAHLLCAINWHIQENETLSSLSCKTTAKFNAEKTRLGKQWFAKNGHRPILFDVSWIEHYQQCEQGNLADITYQRALRFLIHYLAGQFQKNPEFEFANCLSGQNPAKVKPTTKANVRIAG